MHVVIAGTGRVGSTLAGWLADDGHDVTVIDSRQAALERLGKSFNGATLLGLAYDVDILRRAGLQPEDTFVAVTDSDNANLMAVEVAKNVFGVERAIARLYDPAREESYRSLGIHHVTGTKLIANVIFEQVVDQEFAYHVTFTDGDVEVVEFTLNDAAHGVTIDDIEIRNKLRVAAVRRGDHTFIPGRRFELHKGDLVVAAARGGVKRRIEHFLKDQDH
ncbi:MAG: TrkA family potassium uptake protein [Acidimicrobiia bacterium]|nr:TrkA family potassium uptake protein [Acidimicrobiia bacterium]